MSPPPLTHRARVTVGYRANGVNSAAVDAPADDSAVGRSRSGGIALPPHAHLVQMPQQVGRVLVDAIGAGALQLVLAVAAGEQADAERAGAPRGEQVPDAV